MFIPGSLWYQAIGFGFYMGIICIATQQLCSPVFASKSEKK